MLYRNEVSWYLDDGTGRVSVTGAQFAKGFYDTLNKYIFTEPVTEHFERFFLSRTSSCCERVLEVGKPLTIIGKAERNKMGLPPSDVSIRSCEILCLLLTGIGVSILAVSFLRNHLEFSNLF
ncbi:hypothetical protein Bca52824_005489 [Brassica carinata]|uniref:RING-type E3 ubiquitin transferase n=1 Tax=Brassica carinata TaxID=52824 RepID=A0A8X7WQU7_BRACI|nr:hypothetical protein Bca52824_005489 [Brassica carinata]